MALEVGTVQGGQIAALQDGKDGALGKPTGCPKVAFVGCPIPLIRTCVWWSGDNLEHGRHCRIVIFRRRTLASSEAALWYTGLGAFKGGSAENIQRSAQGTAVMCTTYVCFLVLFLDLYGAMY